jgi:hypothetical protein
VKVVSSLEKWNRVQSQQESLVKNHNEKKVNWYLCVALCTCTQIETQQKYDNENVVFLTYDNSYKVKTR